MMIPAQHIIVRWKNNNIVGEGRRTSLLQHLRQQLETKNMIYSKDQIQLSTTVGQGIVIIVSSIFYCSKAKSFRRVRTSVQSLH